MSAFAVAFHLSSSLSPNCDYYQHSAPLLSLDMVAQIFLDKSTIKETKTDDIQDQKANADENGVVLEFQEIGVWTMMRQMRNREWSIPGWNILEDSRKLWTFFPVLYHFLQECFNVAPVFMAIYLVSSFWSSTEVR